MKKRLFVALPISEETRKEALEIQRQYKHLDVRWLFGHNLHITLIPPWWEEDIDKVIQTLKPLEGKISPFDLQFTSLSFGPPRKPHRVIWTEGKAPDQLIKHKESLETTLLTQKIIPKIETRPFRLHMTLARFKPYQYKTFPIKKLNKKIQIQEPIEKFVLMRSHLSRTHAEYEILEEFQI